MRASGPPPARRPSAPPRPPNTFSAQPLQTKEKGKGARGSPEQQSTNRGTHTTQHPSSHLFGYFAASIDRICCAGHDRCWGRAHLPKIEGAQSHHAPSTTILEDSSAASASASAPEGPASSAAFARAGICAYVIPSNILRGMSTRVAHSIHCSPRL